MLHLMADDPTRRDPRPVRQRLDELIDALDVIGATSAVCGAVAMGAHGVRRFTEDIDVLIDAGDLQPLLAALSGYDELGRQPPEGPPAQVRLRARGAGAGEVDIDLLVPISALEQWALTTSVAGTAFGRPVRLVSVEALVVLKLQAFADNRDALVSGQHRFDIGRILEQCDVDLDAVRDFLAGHPLLPELEAILAAPPPRGRR